MTVRELIKMLRKLPHEAQVRTWDADEDDYLPVTGAVEDGTTVDLMTDSDEPSLSSPTKKG